MRRARMKTRQRRDLLKLAREASRGGNQDLALDLYAIAGVDFVGVDERDRDRE